MPEVQTARRSSTARRIFAAVSLIYALAVLGYLALRVLAALGLPVSNADGGLFGMIAGIGSSLMPALLFPALPLVIITGLLRMSRLALLLAPIGMAFALFYGGLFLPRPAQAASPGPALVVYTHNLHAMTDGLQSVAAEIRASGADVVALQELTEPAAEFLGAVLIDLYPYQSVNPVGWSTSGTGILSRWPLQDAETWLSSMVQMRVTVNGPNGPFAFYSAHPPPPSWWLQPFDISDRAYSLTTILDRAAQETLPVVLAGDFNLTDQTSDYQRILNAGYYDSFRQIGWGLGLTFADFRVYFPLLAVVPPFIRIDYVFFSEGFSAIEASAGSSAAGSDHYPVRAVLALNASGGE
ncbi:MAG TPA: endonuclease/exonuclease/phosphatase family protein [Candidatus Limnocylindrales bacterium]|nr:endonuclease/exonuclease/phosphatase family protein [Candidatus Limnocylindrales bacterium]